MERIGRLDVMQRHELVGNYIRDHRDKAVKMAHATGLDGEGHESPHALRNHIMQNVDKIPMRHIRDHLKFLAPHETDHPSREGIAPPHIKDTDHGLSDEELAKRSGEGAGLDFSNMTKGSKVSEVFKDELDSAQFGLDRGTNDNKYGSTKGKGIKAATVFNNLFKGASVEFLEDVFSHPDGHWKATMVDVQVYHEKGYVHADVGFSLKDTKGNKIGSVTRVVTRKEDGLHVENHTLELEKKYQGKGMAETLYNRTEALWRHLGSGNPVHINLLANISVGMYAWAKKGFDFAHPSMADRARDELKRWMSKNQLDHTETLESCGYKSINDIQHAWQFAALDDGNKYDFKGTKDNNGVRFRDVNGNGHLGKAFMLTGKDSWYGVKTTQ
jgi:hypothetical protein